MRRVALLFNPATAVPLKTYMPSIQAAASSFAVEVSAAPVHAKDEIEGVIAGQARDLGGGLIVLPDPFNTTHREQIILLAARYGVPAIYYNPAVYADSGGLIIYGSNFAEQFPLQLATSTAFSKAPNLPTFPCRRRPSSNSSLTSRPRRHSVSTCRHHFLRAPTR
jgi:hypothetical protein